MKLSEISVFAKSLERRANTGDYSDQDLLDLAEQTLKLIELVQSLNEHERVYGRELVGCAKVVGIEID